MKNLAVVGLGYWGPNLARNIANLPNANLYALCDSDPKRLETGAKKVKNLPPSTQKLTNLEDLLSNPEVDAIVFATPVATHYPLAKKALDAGKHVFVEKPLTLREEDAQDLVSLAKNSNLQLCVGHTFLYNPAVHQMKSLIDSGEIGDILHISTRRLNLGLFQKDVNVVWDLMPHDISILLYLLNDQMPIFVSAEADKHYPTNNGIQDTARARLRFPNNVSAYLDVSWIDPQKVREVSVIGSKKMIIFDDTSKEPLRVYSRGVESSYDSFAGFQAAYRNGPITSLPVEGAEPLYVELSHFVDALEGRVPLLTDGMNGYRVVKILNQIQEKINSSPSSLK